MNNIIQIENNNRNSSQKIQFLRLPKPGKRCPITGLSRSGINNLILPTKNNNFKPPVRSYSIKRRGYVRGTRLIVYDSLIEYIMSFGKDDPVLV